MLKQYRAAVIGVICMIAAIIVTGLISLKDEQPTDTQPVIMAEQDMTADKESKAATFDGNWGYGRDAATRNRG